MKRKLVVCNAGSPYCPPSCEEMRKIELKYDDSSISHLYVWKDNFTDSYYFWNAENKIWSLLIFKND